ncbi:hypothetical protein R1sor_009058 [Riccia sorocarpa]|uniref:Uncharacterized protein n=1 Tax=Riccia sorocarpa TaxID=122646 RepID=A0ABD3H8M4_9MARC
MACQVAMAAVSSKSVHSLVQQLDRAAVELNSEDSTNDTPTSQQGQAALLLDTLGIAHWVAIQIAFSKNGEDAALTLIRQYHEELPSILEIDSVEDNDSPERLLCQLPHGRIGLIRQKANSRSRFVHVLYTSRAFEWINLRQLISTVLTQCDLVEYLVDLDDIIFGWRFLPLLSRTCYNPAQTFRDFSFHDPDALSGDCICSKKWYSKFVDLHTRDNPLSPTDIGHIRTMDLCIVKHLELRKELACGLNHIPLRQTSLRDVVDEVLLAWHQVTVILGLNDQNVQDGLVLLRDNTWAVLKENSCRNTGGFKHSRKDVLQNFAASTEIAWLKENFLIAGLDKASNNICFVCVKYVRNAALIRLDGDDFTACKTSPQWDVPDDRIKTILRDISELLPEVTETSIYIEVKICAAKSCFVLLEF